MALHPRNILRHFKPRTILRCPTYYMDKEIVSSICVSYIGNEAQGSWILVEYISKSIIRLEILENGWVKIQDA